MLQGLDNLSEGSLENVYSVYILLSSDLSTLEFLYSLKSASAKSSNNWAQIYSRLMISKLFTLALWPWWNLFAGNGLPWGKCLVHDSTK